MKLCMHKYTQKPRAEQIYLLCRGVNSINGQKPNIVGSHRVLHRQACISDNRKPVLLQKIENFSGV